jgi:hypothetical protein
MPWRSGLPSGVLGTVHVDDAFAAAVGVWPARGIAANGATTNAVASTPTEAIAGWVIENLLIDLLLPEVTIHELFDEFNAHAIQAGRRRLRFLDVYRRR